MSQLKKRDYQSVERLIRLGGTSRTISIVEGLLKGLFGIYRAGPGVRGHTYSCQNFAPLRVTVIYLPLWVNNDLRGIL